MAWAEALDTGITPEDARRAITEHYATSTEWLKPAHINRRCAEYRRVRAEKAAQERELRELEDARARAGMAEETKNKLNEILAKIGKKDGE
jgi:transcription elongation GreA/GreB family factor